MTHYGNLDEIMLNQHRAAAKASTQTSVLVLISNRSVDKYCQLSVLCHSLHMTL